MKKTIIILSAVLFLVSYNAVAQNSAEESKFDEVKIKASMTCNACKETIEKNIAFEKGVKDLSVDLESKIVTIKYNKEKTNPEKLEAAIQKLNFTTELINNKCNETSNPVNIIGVKNCSNDTLVKKCCDKSIEKKCCSKKSSETEIK